MLYASKALDCVAKLGISSGGTRFAILLYHTRRHASSQMGRLKILQKQSHSSSLLVSFSHKDPPKKMTWKVKALQKGKNWHEAFAFPLLYPKKCSHCLSMLQKTRKYKAFKLSKSSTLYPLLQLVQLVCSISQILP